MTQKRSRFTVLKIGVLLAAPVAYGLVLGGCATTKRAAELVVDHHIGMARGALDILSGEAEAREQRVAKLRTDLEASRTALAAEPDRDRTVELLKQHVALQDALVAELLGGPGHHHGGHQHAARSADTEPSSHEH